MRILITGGFGFLGGRLAIHLAQAGYSIVLGSRKDVASPPWLPQSEVMQTDWDDVEVLKHCCKAVDVVIHAAGINAQDCVADPVAALAFNGVATARLVSAACSAGVKRFIYLSTAHVYSSPLVGNITEETFPRNLHPYATSHFAGECVIRSANQRNEIEGIVVRLSNAYGAPVHMNVDCWMLLINDLCRQAATTQSLILRTSGLQRRNFISLPDVCQAISCLLFANISNLSTGIFNVGGYWSPTVWEVACLIHERCSTILNFEPRLIRIAPHKNEHVVGLKYCCDALHKIGFQPSASNVEEIDHLLDFCKTSFS